MLLNALALHQPGGYHTDWKRIAVVQLIESLLTSDCMQAERQACAASSISEAEQV